MSDYNKKKKINWKKSKAKTIKKYLLEQKLKLDEIEYLIEQLDEQTTKLLDKMELEDSESEAGKMVIIYKKSNKNKPKRSSNFRKYAKRYEKYAKIMSFLKKLRKEIKKI